MKKQYFLLTLMSMLLFLGCDKKKDKIFEDSSTVRLNASIDNIYSVLKAKPTWIFSYFPSPLVEYGGFNLFPNFSTNTDVNLQGDYTTENITSTFKIYPGAGPILTFDTYNRVIHFLCAPGYYNGGIGGVDSGMRGDFEFLVLSASLDEIVLKGRKTGNVIKMKPIQASLLPAAIAAYKAANDRFNTYKSGFSIEINGTTLTSTPTVATINGVQRPNRSLPLAGKNVTLSFIVTDTGIDFYKEYEVDGIKLSTMKYNAADAQYPLGYYSNATNTIKIIPK